MIHKDRIIPALIMFFTLITLPTALLVAGLFVQTNLTVGMIIGAVLALTTARLVSHIQEVNYQNSDEYKTRMGLGRSREDRDADR